MRFLKQSKKERELTAVGTSAFQGWEELCQVKDQGGSEYGGQDEGLQKMLALLFIKHFHRHGHFIS